MSRTLDDENQQTSNDLGLARAQLARMMRQGRSFSGRERNCVYLNTGGPRFADVSAVSGLDFPDDARAVGVVDWDQDGDQDLWISNRNAPRLRFLRNDSKKTGRYLALRLVGNGTTTNRDAIGARVEVVAPELSSLKLVDTLRAGEGFLGQSSKWIHFGLGTISAIDRVVVKWPGGEAEDFTGLSVDGRYELVQGQGRGTVVKARPDGASLSPSEISLPNPRAQSRIPLVNLLPMPNIGFQDFQGLDRVIRFGTGRPVLVNLWASWCVPCVRELSELAIRNGELKENGLQVVALSVDGLGDRRASPKSAAAMTARLNLPFDAGLASSGLLQTLQLYHDHLLLMTKPLPVPTSFLVDGSGRLSVIYKGAVAVDQVLADLAHSAGSRADREQRAACLPGSLLPDDGVKRMAEVGDEMVFFQLAESFRANGMMDWAGVLFAELLSKEPRPALAALCQHRLATTLAARNELETAVRHFERAIEIDETMGEAHHDLGMLLGMMDRTEEAVGHFEAAIAIDPARPSVHYNLGNLFIKKERFEEAASAYRQSLEIKPNQPDCVTNLAYALVQLEKVDDAIRVFRTGIELRPRNEDLRTNLAGLFIQQERMEEALKEVNAVLEFHPNSRAATELKKHLESGAASGKN